MVTASLESSTVGKFISKKSARVSHPVPKNMFATKDTQDLVKDLQQRVSVGLKIAAPILIKKSMN